MLDHAFKKVLRKKGGHGCMPTAHAWAGKQWKEIADAGDLGLLEQPPPLR